MKKTAFVLACLLASSLSVAQQGTQSTAPTDNLVQPPSQSTLDRWMDKVTQTVKDWEQKAPQLSEEAKKYAQQLKDQWPVIKDQFDRQLSEAKSKGTESTEAITAWFNKTFSQERVDKAEKWLKDFKSGVEDSVIDPLVPYLLSVRYPNPLDEWNEGYRKLFPVQIKHLNHPLEITLPLSWAISQNMSMGNETLISWRSEGGSGSEVVNLIETPNGTTVDSILAGLQKGRPTAKYETLPGTNIVRITYDALNANDNAMYYYGIPIEDKAFLLCAEVEHTNEKTAAETNKKLSSLKTFYDLVAKNIFVKP